MVQAAAQGWYRRSRLRRWQWCAWRSPGFAACWASIGAAPRRRCVCLGREPDSIITAAPARRLGGLRLLVPTLAWQKFLIAGILESWVVHASEHLNAAQRTLTSNRPASLVAEGGGACSSRRVLPAERSRAMGQSGGRGHAQTARAPVAVRRPGGLSAFPRLGVRPGDYACAHGRAELRLQPTARRQWCRLCRRDRQSDPLDRVARPL